jgi:NAD(P)-dependent dehydrogenase (short-subunit alcohol dehydrogenase family)
MAVVIITGGGGFLGQCLATALLEKSTICTENADGSTHNSAISKIVLADIAFPPTMQPAIEASEIVEQVKGDVSNAEFCKAQIFSHVSDSIKHVSIFHMGAVMSGDGERDFDLAMRVNLYGTLNMLEGARKHIYDKYGFAAKFIFTSAGATIGSGASSDYVSKDDTISDASRATPHTTYGMTKACCELLLADYARRGFVNGRGVRLPSIIVRAGAPNAATTSCFSSVIREPLSGVDVVLPIAPHVPHAVTGKRAAVNAMITVHNTTRADIEAVLGFDRTVFLPAVAVSLGELEEALYKVVTPESKNKLGKITYEVDDFLSNVVGGFPTKIDADRAMKLGVPAAPDAETLVREYIADFSSAVADGIEIVTPSSSTSNAIVVEKVAVITGGGSGIGRGVAQRLSRGGWSVVLAGRRIEALEETEKLLNVPQEKCLCLRTDVSVEKDVEDLFRKTEEKFGKVDLLFNNAGVNSPAASIENVDIADFEKVMKINVHGPFLCAKAAMKLMAKNGGGRIINNGSISAHVPRPNSACYTTSKHALSGLTKCIALDGRALNVACGQIDFGNVVSDLSQATNTRDGALQPNGAKMVEPSMSMNDATEAFWTMANMPLEANVLQMTVMATQMPFVGRG